MKLSEILKERGYVYQYSSSKLEDIVDGPKRTLYLGVDPTADSMHVGQLQGMLVLRRFVDDGHKLIVIVGGGTGMIGDPGGKSTERNLLDADTAKKNAEAIRAQFAQLLGGVEFTMVNNAEWLHQLNYMEFLRDIGKHFTVNEMIKRDSVRPRLETPDQSISYTEFSYMLLQAYDYLELHTRYGCDLQVGGSDQWGNIVSGVELIRKKTGHEAYALSWPLLVDKKTGKKFGKSEGNAVWLDPKKTSPFTFYQFWLNADDEMVHELLLKLTLLTTEEVSSCVKTHDEDRSKRHAQRTLARAVTALVHGDGAAHAAEEVSNILFSDEFQAPSPDALQLLREEAPVSNVTLGEQLVDVLQRTSLSSSKRDARQSIEDGAITLNGARISTPLRVIMQEDFENTGLAVLKKGKRSVAVLFRTS